MAKPKRLYQRTASHSTLPTARRYPLLNFLLTLLRLPLLLILIPVGILSALFQSLFMFLSITPISFSLGLLAPFLIVGFTIAGIGMVLFSALRMGWEVAKVVMKGMVLGAEVGWTGMVGLWVLARDSGHPQYGVASCKIAKRPLPLPLPLPLSDLSKKQLTKLDSETIDINNSISLPTSPLGGLCTSSRSSSFDSCPTPLSASSISSGWSGSESATSSSVPTPTQPLTPTSPNIQLPLSLPISIPIPVQRNLTITPHAHHSLEDSDSKSKCVHGDGDGDGHLKMDNALSEVIAVHEGAEALHGLEAPIAVVAAV